MSILKVWQLTLILAKQDPWGEVIQKKAFLHSSDEKTWFLTFPLIFQMVKNGGLKKLLSMSILKVWQLTLILAKQDSLGRGHIEKWAFLHSSDEKTWFLTFPLIFKWSKMGGLKKLLSMSILKVWQLTLILAKQDPLGRGHIENGLFYTLLMRKHDFWPFHWFSNGQNGGLKKLLSMSILKVWQLTLILAKQDPWGEVI